MKKRAILYLITIITALTFIFIDCGHIHAAEPNMVDYTSYPLFLSESVKPNILIMLDNSGSMNFNAYGPWPGDGGTVNDSFTGEPYHNLEVRVSCSEDDAEERKSDGLSYYNSHDLDLGRDVDSAFPNQIIGLRFNNITIPNGATITKAYIEFNTYAIYSGTQALLPLVIHGEDIDNAPKFDNTPHNISGRTNTSAIVSWAVGTWDTVDEKHQTPDLKDIVQEIVNRSGWSNNNSMAFKITNPGEDPSSGRMATAYDSDPVKAPMFHIEFKGVDAQKYYGYFNPGYFYYYDSNKFRHKYKKLKYVGNPAAGGNWTVYNLGDLDGSGNPLPSATPVTLNDSEIHSQGLWDGNWLNWLCMRRIDILRKVLMGGKCTSRTGGGNETIYGETPAQSDRSFVKHFDSSQGSAVSPYDDDYYYGMDNGYIYVNNNSDPFSSELEKLTIAIEKEIQYDGDSFYKYEMTAGGSKDYSVAGVLQKVGDKARWGNEFFRNGDGASGGSNYDGGFIQHTIGTNMTNLITSLQNIRCDTWTPLAEAYYVAMQYFKQDDVDNNLGHYSDIPNANIGDDPYYNGTEFVYCAKSFVILLTDGASTMDSNIPDFLKDFDGDGDNTGCNESAHTNCDYDDGGTDYLDDVALYARTTDLRSDLEDDQNLFLYTIYAFGDDDNARKLLMDAAKNGGFEDMNGDDSPNGDYSDPAEQRLEWDKDGDGKPDTYFEATDGKKLESELLKAITDILRRAASGTAVSVLSTSSNGIGNLTQAYFKPVVATGADDTKWVGYLQSLWLDKEGNMREDTDQDHRLDTSVDNIIRYTSVNGETKINVFPVSVDDPYPDPDQTVSVQVGMQDIKPIWEAGKLLAEKQAADRKIFTFIDKNNDGIVDESTDDPFDNNGEIVSFDTTNMVNIKPYLGVCDNTTWSYLGADYDDRCNNLISFIRGNDSGFSGTPKIRTRNIDGNVWKLGDIIYSSPIIVSAPPENYDLLYSDESYHKFYQTFKNRETMVYVGANDGMVHAFTSWDYNKAAKTYTMPADAPVTESIGDELWAYIPQCLLPHLKWLASEDYTHVYYADLKPKIFDAKILPDDTHYTDNDNDDNWGTFMLIGLNRGGRHIWAEGDYGHGIETRHFYPSYACLDITDPRKPELLWEKTYSVPPTLYENASNDTDLGLTASYPAVAKVGDEWFAIFGSGPIDFEGTSDRPGHIFVVNLKTGAPYQNGANDWLFEGANPEAFMASPVSLDKNMNYNVDAIYIGETYDSNNGSGFTWKGGMYKITVPFVCPGTCDYYGDLVHGQYVNDPNDCSNPWYLSKLLDSPGPITAPAVLSVDNDDNAWVYFGTGRLLNDDDKSNADQQYFFGIKDPFFNKTLHDSDGYYQNITSTLNLGISDLFDADPYIIVNGGSVYTENGTGNYTYYGDFNYLISQAKQKDGWYRSLTYSGERNITKLAIAGGIVFAPTYEPIDDICGMGGNSYLYAFYYETGTPYKKPVFTDNTQTITIDGKEAEQVKGMIHIGEGMASSPSLHQGTLFTQKSTGEVETLKVDPALSIKSGLKSWIEK